MPSSRPPNWATIAYSATWLIRSPKKLTSWPIHSSEKLRFRASTRYGDWVRPAAAGGAGGRIGMAAGLVWA